LWGTLLDYKKITGYLAGHELTIQLEVFLNITQLLLKIETRVRNVELNTHTSET